MPLDGGSSSAAFGEVPFKEASDFMRQKIDVPTNVWADMVEGAHARGFTVAGATQEGMLVDFHAAIQKAIDEGTTLEDFRKDFDGIVSKTGWKYNGGRNWRSRVIYNTNLTTAYQAGRYAQMTDPDLARARPYWQYCHAKGEKCPRPEHLAWDGLVLHMDDPWWSTHYPPNGWGCRCYVKTLSAGDLKRMGKSGPDKAPAVEMRDAALTTSAGPVTIQVPKGIDPGWGYSVGEANQGKRVAKEVFDAWEKDGRKWEQMTPNDPVPPDPLPVDTLQGHPLQRAASVEELTLSLRRAIGGAEKAIKAPTGDTILVNADGLAAHWDTHLERNAIAPFLPQLIESPAEIWMSFERHPETHRVQLRQRFIRRVDFGRRGILFAANASEGRLEAYTMYEAKPNQLNNQRRGRLIWRRPPILTGNGPTGNGPTEAA